MRTLEAMDTFGDWIRRKRGSRSAAECAEIAGTSPSMWSRWETNERRRSGDKPSLPSYETVEWLAKGLGIKATQIDRAVRWYLIDGNEEPLPEIPDAIIVNPDGTGKVLEAGSIEPRTMTDADARAIAEQLKELFSPLFQRGGENLVKISGDDKQESGSPDEKEGE